MKGETRTYRDKKRQRQGERRPQEESCAKALRNRLSRLCHQAAGSSPRPSASS